MVFPGTDDCDECLPPHLQRRSQAPMALILSSLPFFVTFLFVATVVLQRLFPLLSGDADPSKAGSQYAGASFLSTTSRLARSSSQARPGHDRMKRLSALTFSTTIALSAVLAELVLCEISDTINPVVRGLALRLTIFLLLVLLIAVIPSLEIQSIVSSLGWKYTGPEAGRLKMAWVLQVAAFGVWLLGFWWSGRLILPPSHKHIPSTSDASPAAQRGEDWIHSTTEHVGVIGISLMALLSGFASVSAPWQSFFARSKPVSETAIARKQTGLDSTSEMLSAKRSRLRALEQKMSSSSASGPSTSQSFFSKALTSLPFRSNADAAEKRSLEMEISGLENMALALSTHHALLQNRRAAQQRARTPTGRLLRAASHLFSIYCLYRIATSALASSRRLFTPAHSPSSDSINHILALLVRHWDAQLDRAAWARQISFLTSGIMLAASFSSVLQTFHFFARYTPGLLRAARANLALGVAQVCGVYVISVALLLRGIVPGEVVGQRLRALGGDDEMRWVDGWFDTWFLVGVGVTVGGVWAGRKIVGGGNGEGWDDEDPDDVDGDAGGGSGGGMSGKKVDLEMGGKMN